MFSVLEPEPLMTLESEVEGSAVEMVDARLACALAHLKASVDVHRAAVLSHRALAGVTDEAAQIERHVGGQGAAAADEHLAVAPLSEAQVAVVDRDGAAAELIECS